MRAPRLAPAFALVALLVVSLAGCAPAADVVQVSFDLPSKEQVQKVIDGPPQWYSGILDVFDDVAGDVPGIESLRGEVEAEDTAFGEQVLAQLSSPSGPTAGPTLSWTGGRTSRSGDGAEGFENVIIGAMGPMAQGGIQDAIANGSLAPGESGESGDGIKITQNDDGTVTVEIGTDGQHGEGGTTAGTSMSVTYDGMYCPAADGKFDATAKSKRTVTGTAGGATASRTEEIKATLTGTLGENALPEEITVEATQMTTETGTDGSSRYLTTQQSIDDLDFSKFDATKNPPRKLGGTKGLSTEQEQELANKGQGNADALAFGLLMGLIGMWTDGGCVSIDADLPANVTPKSINDFSIKVKQKLTGSSVKGPLKLELEGDNDLNPQDSVSPGGFHYTAGDPGTTATITITSTSRQGGATKKLPVTVGFDGWEVDGTAAGIHVHGGLCASAWENWSAPQNIVARTDDGEQFLNLRHYPDGDDVSGSLAPPDASSPFGSWQLQLDAAGQPVGITAELSFISRSTADVFTLPASLSVYPATHELTCT